jgi:uncharacterized membrane protein
MSTTTSQADGAGVDSRRLGDGGQVHATDPIARSLGWASLALGVPQITTPGRFAQSIGARDDIESRAWTLLVGVRELAAAAGILALGQPRPKGWLWTRVAGDVMDLTLLVNALRSKREHAGRLMAAAGAVIGITAADVIAAMRMSQKPELTAEPGPMRARAAITVRKPREEIYRFWHDFQSLPSFMAHLDSVQAKADGRFHWKATAPAGRTVEWDAEIVEDRPNELIAWRSLPGAGVANSGSVRFVPAPGDRGTEIHLNLEYAPPAGAVGAVIAMLFGEEPQQQVMDDLRRFKQIAETGVIARSEGTPEGTMTRRLVRQRPAQPVEGSIS